MDTSTDKPTPVPESDEQLLSECRIETFRAGGPGGQHQNTSDSAVRLVHLPTGIRVIARDERSQLRNRALALQRLREKLAETRAVRTPRMQTRVPKREKAKRMEEKRRRGRKKRLRKPPEPDE
jgi:ribosome-associated protein